MKFSINASDKILVIASIPEDIAVACGGFIGKYGKQVDLFCVNKDDFKSPESETQDLRQIKQNRYNEFRTIIQKTNVGSFFIKKPAGLAEEENFVNQNDISNIDLNAYDIILIPQKDDNNPDHQFISSILLKTIINDIGCKDSLKILRYELWAPIKEANYYEDITDYVNIKKELIMSYKKNDVQNFTDNVISNNKFRTFTSYLNGQAEYVEAYFAEDLEVYLGKPDIINESTDENYKNENIENYLKDNDAQLRINDLANLYEGKKVVIYGAGDFSRCVFKNYDLSKLNVVAIADKRFEQNREHEFYGLNCVKPKDLGQINADVLLIFDMNFIESYDFLMNTVLGDKDIEIAPLIKTDLSKYVNGDVKNKVCARPFHNLLIVPTGHCTTCCPAYIKNFTLGNLFKSDFKTIWNGKRAQYLRKALTNNDYTTCDLNTCIYMDLVDKQELSKYYEDDNKTVKMPDTIFMGWDYDCNVACITCRNELIKNDEKTLKELAKIENCVLEACKSAKFFYASGNGDPFGSAYARSIIKKVVQINPQIKFFIHTNGILCEEKICDELGIKDKINTIIFSIHSSCKETYDKIVRYGNFDKVIKNLEWVSSLKREGKIDEVYMVFVVHKLNYKDMPDFVRMAEKYNVIASFRYYRQWSHNTEYSYDDMAIFEKTHPEYSKFVEVLQDKIFDSPNCYLDPSLKLIRNDG